jgi:hypothetical protein
LAASLLSPAILILSGQVAHEVPSAQVLHPVEHAFTVVPSNQYPSITAEHLSAPESLHVLHPVAQLEQKVGLLLAFLNLPSPHDFTGAHRVE